MPDSVRGAAALQYFDRHAAYFRKMAETGAFTVLETGEDLEKLGNKQGTAFILTVEGGSAVAGDLKNIHHLRENGVRVMTLTWNGSNEIGRGGIAGEKIGLQECNEIGSGVMSGDKFGLTPFGKLAVKEMEKEGIVIDISHASEALFYDVAGNTERPFIATHSNSKVLCKHPRNLTDDQFRIICNRGGLVGLNYFKALLNDAPAKADIEDLFAHAEHFLSLGGADVVAMGSDFDGSDMPHGITGLESVEDIANVFLRHNLPEALVDKIFFENAASFFKRFDRNA